MSSTFGLSSRAGGGGDLIMQQGLPAGSKSLPFYSFSPTFLCHPSPLLVELELELIQTHMTQKPLLVASPITTNQFIVTDDEALGVLSGFISPISAKGAMPPGWCARPLLPWLKVRSGRACGA
jgi:hypothetical protein